MSARRILALAPLLESRAKLLLQWVADDAIWSEE